MKQQSITTLPPSPEDERRRRMVRYTVTMGIRMVCIVLMLFAQGWWLLVCALGAILLPYFAVIAANVHGDQRAPTVLRPGALTLVPRPGAGSPGTDDASADGARTDGARTDGARADGTNTDEARTDGPSTDGPRTDGPRTDGAPL